jgi:hypothetical protein
MSLNCFTLLDDEELDSILVTMMFLVVDSFSVDCQLNRRTRYRNEAFNEDGRVNFEAVF